MCELALQPPTLKVADKDIVVYKQVRRIEKKLFGFPISKKIYSLVYGYSYKKNKVYTTKLDEFKYDDSLGAFYSCSGFYSYSSKRFTDSNAQFIIPKGAKYYLIRDLGGHIDVYISNKIKYVKYLG